MNLPEKSLHLRREIIKAIYAGGAGHYGGTSSILDVLVYMAYEMEIPVKEILIGKGHACLASWCIMVDRQEMKKEMLESYGKDGGLGGQFDLSNGALNTGSLGHALGVGVGLALANSNKKIYVILGDSELSEGSVTEAAEFAGNHNLKNLTLIADFNGFGVSGPAQAKLEGKTGILARFEALGWESVAVNGHDFSYCKICVK